MCFYTCESDHSICLYLYTNNYKWVCVCFVCVYSFHSVLQMDDCLQKSLSVLDRLLLTHSIWLQLSINPDSALCILQREIVGVRQYSNFLRWPCKFHNKHMLYVWDAIGNQYLGKALFGCVLKPLKLQLGQTLLSLHTQDGSLQRFANSLQACQQGTLERLGVRSGVLDAQGIERAKKKLTLMQRSHSPIDKVLLLLQVCKSVYKAMGSQPGQDYSSEDFLPVLSYVVVQCNIPQLMLETEYMMELLEPSWLTGEGGYYLTSVYASVCLIQSQPGTPSTSGLTNEARESLREWSRRREPGLNTHTHTLSLSLSHTLHTLSLSLSHTPLSADPQKKTLFYFVSVHSLLSAAVSMMYAALYSD
uniref:Ras and Rab interactor 2 n=1 Tax=Astyanax mexicanus TaxID=7994 RepID=A0A8B9GNC8_ASTMX